MSKTPSQLLRELPEIRLYEPRCQTAYVSGYAAGYEAGKQAMHDAVAAALAVAADTPAAG